MCVYVCVCERARARVLACSCVRARASRVCVRACMRVQYTFLRKGIKLNTNFDFDAVNRLKMCL